MKYSKTSAIKIYPGYNQFRYSFYIKGINQIFFRENIHYSSIGFPIFGHHALPFIVGSNPGLKIYISAGDGPGYNMDGLDWSDVYVKRTLINELVPEKYKTKIIPMGPHFGIRVLGFIPTLYQAIRTYFFWSECIENPRDHIWNYFKQFYFRLPEKAYVPGNPDSKYVFYAATLYPTHPNYNRYRATFIEACRESIGIEFEGGFIRKDTYRVPEYLPYTINKYYPISEWVNKSKKSSLGFWAPGDQGAMTLKLGEFLALGKAIIAVPIRQEQLPSPLVHGEHVHFVDGSLEEMKKAVQLLTTDNDYRQKLERNARTYYEQWVSPEQAIQRYIREGCERAGISIEGSSS